MFWYFMILLLKIWIECSFAHSTYPTLPCLNKESLWRNGRIVGGEDAERGETPFIISLTRRGGHFCGGIVFNEQWLLTAGHCVCNGLGRIMKPTQIKAVLGLYKITEFNNNEIDVGDEINEFTTPSSAYEIDIEQIITHPEYNCDSPQNDIALLKVTKRIEFSDMVHPACIKLNNDNEMLNTILPTMMNKNDNNNHQSAEQITMMATVSGWGWTNEDQGIGVRPNILQKAIVNVYDSEKCQELYQSNLISKKFQITKRQLCAGHLSGGIDSCWADSGGPLIIKGNVLIGIVSTGIGCARPGLPGIYTKISEYVDWIESITMGI